MDNVQFWTTLLQWPLIWLIVAQVTFNKLRPEIRDVL